MSKLKNFEIEKYSQETTTKIKTKRKKFNDNGTKINKSRKSSSYK